MNAPPERLHRDLHLHKLARCFSPGRFGKCCLQLFLFPNSVFGLARGPGYRQCPPFTLVLRLCSINSHAHLRSCPGMPQARTPGRLPGPASGHPSHLAHQAVAPASKHRAARTPRAASRPFSPWHHEPTFHLCALSHCALPGAQATNTGNAARSGFLKMCLLASWVSNLSQLQRPEQNASYLNSLTHPPNVC